MNDTEHSRWPRTLFFIFIGLFFAASFYWISIRQVDLSAWRSRRVVPFPARDIETEAIAYVAGDEITLSLDEPADMNDMRIIYRGMDRGVLNLDLIIPELDSQYAYAYRIPKKQAKQGFRMYGRSFTLTYSHDTRIRLKWVE